MKAKTIKQKATWMMKPFKWKLIKFLSWRKRKNGSKVKKGENFQFENFFDLIKMLVSLECCCVFFRSRLPTPPSVLCQFSFSTFSNPFHLIIVTQKARRRKWNIWNFLLSRVFFFLEEFWRIFNYNYVMKAACWLEENTTKQLGREREKKMK